MLSDEKLIRAALTGAGFGDMTDAAATEVLAEIEAGDQEMIAEVAGLRAVAEAAVKDAVGGEAEKAYCKACRQVGMVHCSQPEYCGGPWDDTKEKVVMNWAKESGLTQYILATGGNIKMLCAAYDLARQQASTAVPDLSACFMTAESGGGEYKIVLRFQTLTKMQDAHSAMVHWLATSQPEVK